MKECHIRDQAAHPEPRSGAGRAIERKIGATIRETLLLSASLLLVLLHGMKTVPGGGNGKTRGGMGRG